MVNACSGILHASNPYDEEPSDPEEFIERSGKWKQQILTLLNHHQIQLVDNDSQWWVLMEAESDGEVHVTEMKKIGEA